LRRVAAVRRRLSYDLLPLDSTPAARAHLVLARPKTPGFQPSDAARSWHRALRRRYHPPLPSLADGWVDRIRAYFQTETCIAPCRMRLGQIR